MKRTLILLILLSVALVQVVGGPEPAFADSLETLRAEVARIAQTVDDEVPEPVDSGVGASIAFAGEEPISLINGDHRFPMMSTVKIPVSMEALDLVSQGKLTLEEQITITDEDLSVLSPVNLTFPQAPTTTKLYNLIWTAIVDSDNTTPNTMMRLMYGPKGVEAWVQEQGVEEISVERNLNDLFMDAYDLDNFDEVIEFLNEQDEDFFLRPLDNSSFWDDERDTTTPDAMVQLLSKFMANKVLDKERTEVLIDIMEQTRTGKARLQGMLPPGTVVGDKTGTGHDSVNDVGWIRLPDGEVLVIAVYNCNKASFDTKEQVIAQIARAAYDWAIYAAK